MSAIDLLHFNSSGFKNMFWDYFTDIVQYFNITVFYYFDIGFYILVYGVCFLVWVLFIRFGRV